MPDPIKPLKLVFAGTPDFAARHLVALLQSDHQVVAVYTQPDRPAGRGKKSQASPVKLAAQNHSLAIFQPLNFKEADTLEVLKSHEADVMVVVAYGLLLPKVVLETPRLGCINVHASILPRWRGAAPIQRAIEAGDDQTGVTIMQMDVGLDTGDMLNKVFCDILPSDTASDLHDRLAALGPPALIMTLDQMSAGTTEPQAQEDEHANYAKKLIKEEGNLDWRLPAAVLHRRIRAFNPYPMCFFLQGKDRVRVLAAEITSASEAVEPGTIVEASKAGIVVACRAESALRLTTIQLPGKKPMAVSDLLNGKPDAFQVGQSLANHAMSST